MSDGIDKLRCERSHEYRLYRLRPCVVGGVFCCGEFLQKGMFALKEEVLNNE